MLINDFSKQQFLEKETTQKQFYLELVAAGTFLLAPILLLILISS